MTRHALLATTILSLTIPVAVAQGSQTQADLDALAARITNDVNTQVPGGEPFAGVAYPLTLNVGDVNLGNLGSLTDKDGNTWTLTMAQPFGDNTGGNQWWGGVQENGQQLWDGYNIALRLVNGDVWVEEAKFGGWWNLTVGAETNNFSGRPGETGDPGQGSGGQTEAATAPSISQTQVATASPSDTAPASSDPPAAVQSANLSCPIPSGAITPGAGSVTDAAGNVYTVDPTAGNQVMVNGQPATPNGEGKGTSAVAVVDGNIYGQDQTTQQWFALIQDPSRPYWQPLTGLPVSGQPPSSTARWDTATAVVASCADATKQNASGTQNPASGTLADILKVCSDPATTSNPTNATICAQAQQTQALIEQTNALINANQKTATPPSPTGPGF